MDRRAERATEVLKTLLMKMGWTSEQAEPGVFSFDFGDPSAPVSTGLAAILPDTRQFVFYLNFGFFVPVERRDRILRYIADANWDLIVGSFEIDLRDGHVRFKSSLDFDGDELSEALVSNAVAGAMKAVEAHADGLRDLCGPDISMVREVSH